MLLSKSPIPTRTPDSDVSAARHSSDERIDCGVCVPECPAEAIFADSDPAAEPKWLAQNRKYASLRPNIAHKKTPPADADT
jgi:Fe-S-cluster-containing hydrogenase component 2